MSVRDRAGESRDDLVVAALQRLAPHLDGEPDPAFRAATRARLVAMAAVRSPEPEPVSGLKRLLAARPDAATRPRWRTRLTAGLAGAALTVTAAASLVALAGNARPGDVLYGLKRGTEQTQLALAGDARGTTLLGFASTRLDELRGMVDSPNALVAPAGTDGASGQVLAAGADPRLVISTLRTMDDETTQGTAWLTDRAVSAADRKPLDQLSVWVATQTDGLAGLAPKLPGAAGTAVQHSLDLLTRVSTRTAGLDTALDCPAGPAVGAADALGPTPAACAPAPPQTPGSTRTDGSLPGTGTTGGAVPSTAAVPTPDGSTAGPLPGHGGGTLPAPVPGNPTVPGLPSVTVPTVPGSLSSSLNLPAVPLPGTSSAPLINLPPTGPLGVCLPSVVNC